MSIPQRPADPERLRRIHARRRAARRRMMRRRRRTLFFLVIFTVSFVGGRALLTGGEEGAEGSRPLREGGVAGAATPPPDDRPNFPIKHVVFIVKENRTFDNYFARYPGADGAEVARISNGNQVLLQEATDVLEPDLGHSFADAVEAINGGRMDRCDKVQNG